LPTKLGPLADRPACCQRQIFAACSLRDSDASRYRFIPSKKS
jgi:hypothetical protein